MSRWAPSRRIDHTQITVRCRHRVDSNLTTLCQQTQKLRYHLQFPVDGVFLNAPSQAFSYRKLKGEQTYMNYIVRRGPWINEPPQDSDFGSCMDGPTFYVNDVVDKNVSQIWERTASGWVSVKEGHRVVTKRERRLSLDEHQVPRLLVQRMRSRKSIGSKLRGAGRDETRVE